MAEANGPVVSNIYALVLGAETNAGRFESFCREVIAALEGDAVVFSTSPSWDLGRDGVGGGRASGVYVCTSLRDDVDIKALSDIQRITSTTHRISRLYFCSNHVLSEHAIDKIEKALSREINDAFAVTCLGATQLLEAAQARTPQTIEKNYGAEIKNTLRAIQRDPDDDTEIRGLRLALLSAAGDDSQAIRAEVYTSGLLDVLMDRVARTPLRCGKDFSNLLRLQRNIAIEAIQPHLMALQNSGHLHFDGTVYLITEQGLAEVRRRDEEAAARLLTGRQAIRDALETAIGTVFSGDHFNSIWTVFEEKMAQYFLARGDALVEEICAIFDENAEQHGNRQSVSPLSFLEEFANSVANTSSNPQQRGELFQAVKDLFTDRTSVATDWLLRISASFVAACAIGLEHSSNSALAKLLSRTHLALDTDVVLSLVGEGEPEHESVVTIVNRWTRLGGKVLIAESVLEEVAYHAHIAQADFDEVRSRLPGTPEERIHIIDNVFVRSFAELIAQNKATLRQWGSYIAQFRGPQPRDFTNALGTICTDYPLEKLPPRSLREAELEDAVKRFLVDNIDQIKFHGDALRNAKDKARRDAELYSALVHYVKTLKAADPGSTCLLVSSARRLLQVENKFHESSEPQLIVSISAVLYLVSMLPDVSLGLSAMKAFLFDERRRGFSSDLERTLIRLVRSSQEVAMPWAKRGNLMRSLRERMIKDAHAQGIKHVTNADLQEMERAALQPNNRGRTLELLKDSLDAIVVDTRQESEISSLKERIRELEARLSFKQ